MLIQIWGYGPSKALEVTKKVILPVLAEHGVAHPMFSLAVYDTYTAVLDGEGNVIEQESPFIRIPAFAELRGSNADHVSDILSEELGHPVFFEEARIVFNP
jgi:hypothetical protein